MKRFFIFLELFIGVVFLLSRPALAFEDVTDSYSYSTAVSYFSSQSYITGYEGNLFRPEKRMNRAEFLKVVLIALNKEVPPTVVNSCFSDVPQDAWYAPYVCFAKQQGYVKGYNDGLFRPGNFLTVGETAILAVKIFEKDITAAAGDTWYSAALRVLADEQVLPQTFQYANQPVTRGEVVEMLWRLLTDTHDLPTAKAADIEGNECISMGQELPDSVRAQEVRTAWLQWMNQARAAGGLPPYLLNDQLTRTATQWSNYSRARGSIDHKRPGQTAYYDYAKIIAWFKNLGLVFQQIGRSGAAENITWNIYSCSAVDCTDELIQASREGFDYFMSGKGKSYSPHYDSIMSPNFKLVGLGLAVDEAKHKFYLTVHYGTEILSDPLAVCPNS